MLRHLVYSLGSVLRWGFYILLLAGICVYVFLLIFSWLAPQRETQLAGDIAPPKGRYVKAADVNIFVQEAGPPDGMDVLLVPGIGGWSGTWPESTCAAASRRSSRPPTSSTSPAVMATAMA